MACSVTILDKWSSHKMRVIIALCILLYQQTISSQSLPPTCPSEIYCFGELLQDVQMSRLYPDSKTFVDMRLKSTPAETLNAFNDLKKEKANNISIDDIKNFVNTYFMDGDELEMWNPSDWTSTPSLANRVADPKIRTWVLQLNEIWKTLSRKIKEDVKINPDHYSLIYVPNGFVIPGGRFRELYYWDTYWIIKGLMLSDMHETAKGVIENLLHLVQELGHMPNGNRVYYWERSQPPLLTQMVDYYFMATGDRKFLKDAFPILKKEMEWWLDNRSVKISYRGRTHQLFRYYAPSEGPRPESYREDVETVEPFETDSDKTSKYIALKSGAESGWDYSTRWFIKDGTNNGNLSDIDTENIIPVDLNAFMQRNFAILTRYAIILKDRSLRKYSTLANQLQESIDDVLFDNKKGIWYDFDIKNMKKRNYFYLSNFAPLWTRSFNPSKKYQLTNTILNYVNSAGLLKYPGGSPTSEINSGQQWDYPNAWPPLQAILIYGLKDLGTVQANYVARKLAEKWVLSNYNAFANTTHMFEKYNSNVFGAAGGGGEYDVQAGFGWTNGVILEMIDSWPTISTAGT